MKPRLLAILIATTLVLQLTACADSKKAGAEAVYGNVTSTRIKSN